MIDAGFLDTIDGLWFRLGVTSVVLIHTSFMSEECLIALNNWALTNSRITIKTENGWDEEMRRPFKSFIDWGTPRLFRGPSTWNLVASIAKIGPTVASMPEAPSGFCSKSATDGLENIPKKLQEMGVVRLCPIAHDQENLHPCLARCHGAPEVLLLKWGIFPDSIHL